MPRLLLMDSRDARGGHSPRRGIILLFVLALLALFSLVTVTFVLVSRQSKLSALYSSRAEQTINLSQTQNPSQIRGDADKRQVEGAKVGLQHNIGLGGAAVVTVYKPAVKSEALVNA